MKPLTIELAKGTQRHLQCLGWKSGGNYRRRFFALDQDGKPLVVTPKPAMPEFYDPNRRAKAIFCGEPFPEAVCVEILPCRLLAPPCYQSRQEFESQRDGHFFWSRGDGFIRKPTIKSYSSNRPMTARCRNDWTNG